MSFGEAQRLTRILALDPSSQVCAAVNGWEYPVGRDAMVLMDHYDLTFQVHAKNPKAYPRPWRALTRRRTAPAPDLTQAEIVAALREIAGHTAELPTR